MTSIEKHKNFKRLARLVCTRLFFFFPPMPHLNPHPSTHCSYSIKCLVKIISPPQAGWEKNCNEAAAAGAVNVIAK